MVEGVRHLAQEPHRERYMRSPLAAYLQYTSASVATRSVFSYRSYSTIQCSESLIPRGPVGPWTGFSMNSLFDSLPIATGTCVPSLCTNLVVTLLVAYKAW